MSVFDSGLPSVRQIQSLIKNKRKVEIGLLTNTSLQGKILWQDPNCLCLIEEQQDNSTLIWFQAIAYITPQGVENQSTMKMDS